MTHFGMIELSEQCVRGLLLNDFKSGESAAPKRSINAAFGDGTVSECTRKIGSDAHVMVTSTL